MQCFVVQSDEIEGRLDVFYYQPEFIELERKIKKHSSKTLGDFIINISSGATPEKDESEKYYTVSPENGVPFLRVQNVTENGLSLEDCKFINFDTHNGMLKRSQVKEGYLLTKITGVGRMAVSSVAPNGFDGNINQHLVAIKTDGYQTSEVLAAFLNSDIGERLAFRRSTGGTRPALDYQALKTIPVIFKPGIVDIMQSAYAQKKQKEAEAQKLLDSIDGYVLDELGIELPEIEDKMFFVVSSDEVKSNRLDAYYYQPRFEEVEKALRNGKYTVESLKSGLNEITSGQRPKGGVKQISDGVPSLGGEHILGNGCIATQDLKFIPNNFHESHLKSGTNKNDILLVKDGATTGKVGIIPEDYPFDEVNINEHVFLIRCKKDINPYYLFSFLKSTISQIQINREITGGTIMGIVREAVENLSIPLPPIEIQNKIADEVKRRISEAEMLKAEASRVIEEAKKKVEKMMLNE